MSEAGHNYKFGGPRKGWPTFDKKTGKVIQMPRAYVAGPMRGYDLYNFPMFDTCRDRLLSMDWDVVSPADLDRDNGIFETTTVLPEGFIFTALRRDFAAIVTCEAIVFLPNWELSSGSRAEARVGLDIGLDFYKFNPRSGSVVKLRRQFVESIALCV